MSACAANTAGEQNRRDALADAERARKLAYRHAGRFDTRVLSRLDARPDVRQGDQFNFRLTGKGAVNKRSPTPWTRPNSRRCWTPSRSNSSRWAAKSTPGGPMWLLPQRRRHRLRPMRLPLHLPSRSVDMHPFRVLRIADWTRVPSVLKRARAPLE